MDDTRDFVLVVDDLADAADTTVELLLIWGYDAIACYTGEAALKSACLHRPAVVILDLAMPRMDGFQFVGLFHELPGCGLVPIIALTGHTSPAYRVKAREAGIRHYLLKPTDPESLKELLAQEVEPTVTPAARVGVFAPLPTVKFLRPRREILHGAYSQRCPVPVTKLWGNK